MANSDIPIAFRMDGQGVRGLTSDARRDDLRADYGIAAGCVAVLTLAFIAWSDSVVHWFLLPVMACGILSGVDIVRWLRGKLDLFDPQIIIGCVAFYGLFVAPLLNVCWDTYGAGDLIFWGDWRPWLGAMACLDTLGLGIYRCANQMAFAHTQTSARRWEIDARRPYPFFAFGLLLSIAGAVEFLRELHGISGMVRSFESDPDAFAGKGWLLIFAWPMAVLVFIAVAYVLTRRDKKAATLGSVSIAILVLLAAGVSHFLLVGSYGSRGDVVWALFWMLGIVHYRLRKFSNKLMIVAVIFLVGFMYLYGFYKERQSAAWDVLRAPSAWLDPQGYQRDIKYLLLGDLARADSNAFMLRNLVVDPDDYDYRWGLTYIAAPSFVIPKSLWPQRPQVRVDAGSEALWGKATQWKSSRLYGLGGEAMLNFGPWGVVPVFGVYGGLLGWYRRKLSSWDRADARIFLAPFFTSLLVRGFVYDSDTLLFSSLTQGTLVILVLFLASKGVPRRSE
jgi:hypothetical protein